MLFEKIKFPILFAALFAGLVGCSRDEKPADGSSFVPTERVEILLSGDIVVPAGNNSVAQSVMSAATRGVVEQEHAALSVSFARLDQNEADGLYPAYTTLSAALTAELAANTGNASTPARITFTTPQYYLSRATNNNTKLVGWHPQAVPAAGVVSLAVNGENDVMLTQELVGNKEAANRFGTASKVFNFEHQLTQLKVEAYAADEAAATNWGSISAGGVVLESQLPTCEITLPATVAFTGTAADLALPAYQVSDNAAITYPLAIPAGEAAAVECGYAMIAPVAAGGSLTLKITTEQGGTYSNVPVSVPAAGFEAGKAYTVLLKFTASEIVPTATISAWVEVPEKVEVIL